MIVLQIVRRDNMQRDPRHRPRRRGRAIYFGSTNSELPMKKLPEVETAKALMTEAMTWSVMRWLREKKRVRKGADAANAALDRLSLELRQHWPSSVQAAYAALAVQSTGAPRAAHPQCTAALTSGDSEAALKAKQMKDADEHAYRARMDAEATFDDAEKQLSTRRAREGCQKAIRSWELHEGAIRKSEAIVG
jgi:hypothetical protein